MVARGREIRRHLAVGLALPMSVSADGSDELRGDLCRGGGIHDSPRICIERRSLGLMFGHFVGSHEGRAEASPALRNSRDSRDSVLGD